MLGIQKFVVISFMLLQTVSFCWSSYDRQQSLIRQAAHDVRAQKIVQQRKHCASLIQMHRQVEEELKYFDTQILQFAGIVDCDQEYRVVMNGLEREKWEDLQLWYSAHFYREQLFLDHRNSGDDLNKLYGTLEPKEKLMKETLHKVQPFNRKVKELLYRKVHRLTTTLLTEQCADTLEQKTGEKEWQLFLVYIQQNNWPLSCPVSEQYRVAWQQAYGIVTEKTDNL